MEPLIENVLERVDSRGDLLAIVEGSKRKIEGKKKRGSDVGLDRGLEGIDEEDSVVQHTNGNKSLIPFSNDHRKDNESELSNNAKSIPTLIYATDVVSNEVNGAILYSGGHPSYRPTLLESTFPSIQKNITETNAEYPQFMSTSVVIPEEIIDISSNSNETEQGSKSVSKLALFKPESLIEEIVVETTGEEGAIHDSADSINCIGRTMEIVEGKGEDSLDISDQKVGGIPEEIDDDRKEDELNRNHIRNIDTNDLIAVDPLNNGNSFKQLQYQVRQQRHRQAYQPPDAEIEDKNKISIPVQAISQSSFHQNLHLEMSSLANSASLHSPGHQNSYSLTHRSVRELSLAQAITGGEEIEEIDDENDNQQELLTDKAVTVIRRVMDKLTGLDFYDPSTLAPPVALDVPEQVDRLIIQATSNENLCLSFLGWCPFW
jgi:hypothetical protein